MSISNQASPSGISGLATCVFPSSGLKPVTRARFGLVAVILAACMGFHPTISDAAPPEVKGPGAGSETWAKGRILVVPRAGLPEKELAKILGAHGGKGRKIGQSDLYIVDLPGNASEKAIAARLAHHPHLKFAEPDYLVTPDFVPNDPYYGSAWHLPKIGAASAWDGAQGAGVTIAILDSGVDSAHPDLAARMVPGWNFYDNNSNTSDVYGHGTKVAGAAAAAGNNGVGVASVSGQSKIMPIRVTNTSGAGYVSMLAQGTTWAADRGARVVNMSFALIAGSSTIQNAAQYMKNKGGLVVVGAGNSGINETYAPTTTLIAVSATDSNDAKASWSSYGNFVAVSAPGAGIWTTTRGGGYGAVSGTSFSSPVTAGVVALMMSAAPTLQNTKIESLLFSTAVDLGAAGRDPYYGYGRVNAGAAVKAAVAAVPVADTQPPVVSISAPLGGATVTGLVPVNVTATDNTGVTHVELRVNSTTVAIDTSAPFGFTWDSTGTPNGMSNLVAYAFDAAGNSKASTAVAVNVANGTVTVAQDTTAPAVQIINPVAGSVSGSNVAISVNATDDSGAAGITQTVYIDGVLKATGSGSTLGYNWNIRKVAAGTHTVEVVTKDLAGNAASASVNVTVIK
ncbi:peptidase S8 [Nitrosospira lacus]|uniref:Peptidase S8 n=1 Tax=Nitrosospira lacus TaxID=1288494 RepID=A0A1W6SP45_9PROT|nr:S8 family serine peptidase [Nitrosospira lacus]ARO87589.1 peptidase S8 [Nitrosospira lacus]